MSEEVTSPGSSEMVWFTGPDLSRLLVSLSSATSWHNAAIQALIANRPDLAAEHLSHASVSIDDLIDVVRAKIETEDAG